MKKIISLLTMFVLLGVPLATVVGFSYSDGADTVKLTDTIDDDHYAVGGTVFSEATINGDLVVAGGEVAINGDVKQDVLAAGGSVIVNGIVEDDLRVTGGEVTIRSKVNGDIVAAGGTVSVDSIAGNDVTVAGGEVVIEGEIKGNLIVVGGDVTLDANVAGNVELSMERLTIGENASIAGNLEYMSKKQLPELEAIVAGTASYEKAMAPQAKHVHKSFIRGVVKFWVFKLIGVILFAMLLLYGLPKLFAEAGTTLKKQRGRSLLAGFLLYILLPIVGVLLMVSMIGFPVGAFMLVLFAFLLVFTDLFIVAVLARWISTFYKKDLLWWQMLLLVAALSLVFVSINGIDVLVAFFAYGAITVALKNKGLKLLECECKK